MVSIIVINIIIIFFIIMSLCITILIINCNLTVLQNLLYVCPNILCESLKLRLSCTCSILVRVVVAFHFLSEIECPL